MLTGPKGKKFNFLEYSGDFAAGAIEWDFFHLEDGMEQRFSQFALQNGQARIPEASIFCATWDFEVCRWLAIKGLSISNGFHSLATQTSIIFH